MKNYIVVNPDNRVVAVGDTYISISGHQVFELELVGNEDIFINPSIFTYINGELIRDDVTKLAMAKKDKFSEMSETCMNEILGYFKATVNDVEYEFSYDYEAQANFTGTMVLFMSGMIQDIEWTAHKDGRALRIILNQEQFINIATIAFAHKNSKIAKLRNEIQIKIENAQTIDEVFNIVWIDETIEQETEEVIEQETIEEVVE